MSLVSGSNDSLVNSWDHGNRAHETERIFNLPTSCIGEDALRFAITTRPTQQSELLDSTLTSWCLPIVTKY
jgi:hypothetical protein